MTGVHSSGRWLRSRDREEAKRKLNLILEKKPPTRHNLRASGQIDIVQSDADSRFAVAIVLSDRLAGRELPKTRDVVRRS